MWFHWERACSKAKIYFVRSSMKLHAIWATSLPIIFPAIVVLGNTLVAFCLGGRRHRPPPRNFYKNGAGASISVRTLSDPHKILNACTLFIDMHGSPWTSMDICK